MPDKGWRLAHQEEWLARILDPKAALGHRGSVLREGALGFRIVAPDGGSSTLLLDLSGGVARVRDASPDVPTVTLTTFTFATLFTGFRSASRLRCLGLVEGDDDATRFADLVLCGPAPWLAERV